METSGDPPHFTANNFDPCLNLALLISDYLPISFYTIIFFNPNYPTFALYLNSRLSHRVLLVGISTLSNIILFDAVELVPTIQ
jgi:hypothetical protein